MDREAKKLSTVRGVVKSKMRSEKNQNQLTSEPDAYSSVPAPIIAAIRSRSGDGGKMNGAMARTTAITIGVASPHRAKYAANAARAASSKSHSPCIET